MDRLVPVGPLLLRPLGGRGRGRSHSEHLPAPLAVAAGQHRGVDLEEVLGLDHVGTRIAASYVIYCMLFIVPNLAMQWLSRRHRNLK